MPQLVRAGGLGVTDGGVHNLGTHHAAYALALHQSLDCAPATAMPSRGICVGAQPGDGIDGSPQRPVLAKVLQHPAHSPLFDSDRCRP